jgi:hypothetical protein
MTATCRVAFRCGDEVKHANAGMDVANINDRAVMAADQQASGRRPTWSSESANCTADQQRIHRSGVGSALARQGADDAQGNQVQDQSHDADVQVAQRLGQCGEQTGHGGMCQVGRSDGGDSRADAGEGAFLGLCGSRLATRAGKIWVTKP